MGTIAGICDPVNCPANGTAHPTTYQYDSQGNVTQVTDQNTHVTTYTYDGNGNQLTRTVDPSGLDIQTRWTYDNANNVLTESDPAPQGINPNHGSVVVTAYSYDSPTAGDAVQVVKNYLSGVASDTQTNLTTTATYDSAGEQLTVVHPTTSSTPSVTTQNTYDSYGDVTQTIQNDQPSDPTQNDCSNTTTGCVNVTTSATFDSLGEPLTATDAKGVVTQTVYNVDGTVAETKANSVASDPTTDHCPTTVGTGPSNLTGCANVVTTNSYDRLGRLLTTTNPKGVVTKTVYDADGRTTETIQNDQASDPNNNDCTNTATGCVNATTTTAYDAAGNATLSTDYTGATASTASTATITTTTFDADNRAIEVQVQTQSQAPNSPVQPVKDTTTGYDAVGNTTTTQTWDDTATPTPALLTTTSYTYDAANRKLTELDPPANPGSTDPSDPGLKPNLTTYTYDQAGTVTATVVDHDPQGANTLVTKTTTTPDALGRPLSQVDAANGSSAAQTTSYSYDFGGRQTGSTGLANTGSPQQTTTSYDNLDQVTSVVHPDQSSETSTYDADGQQLTHTNCGGTLGATGSTTDTYDNLGNAIQQVLKDCNGNPQSTEGDLFDADGNLTQRATTPAGGSTTSFSFSYNQLDQPTSLNDIVRQYILDALGNVTSMTVTPSSTAPTAASYQASYDTGHRLTSLTSYGGAIPPLHSYSYSYDQHNNRSSITADGTTTSYTYDAYNQLLTSTVGSGSTPTVSYEYDANHNRLKMTTAAGTTQYTYDDSDTRLTQLTDPSNKVTTFTYDQGAKNEVGNLTQKVYDPTGANQTTSYTYDTSNRLSTVTLPSGTVVAFTYDANGNRTQKSVTPSGGSATVTNDTYQNGLLQYETNGSGTLMATFTYDGQGVPVSVRVGSDPNNSPLYYYVYNGHGDVDALVDSSGTVVASYTYDDWGAITTSSENFANANGWTNPYRYDGQDRVRYDTETGLYWMSVRAYDPTLGRFLSHDPLGRLAAIGLDSEPYVYAGNNPLVHVDPSGMYRAWDGMTQEDVKHSRIEEKTLMRTYKPKGCDAQCQSDARHYIIQTARGIAHNAADWFKSQLADPAGLAASAITVPQWILTVAGWAGQMVLVTVALTYGVWLEAQTLANIFESQARWWPDKWWNHHDLELLRTGTMEYMFWVVMSELGTGLAVWLVQPELAPFVTLGLGLAILVYNVVMNPKMMDTFDQEESTVD